MTIQQQLKLLSYSIIELTVIKTKNRKMKMLKLFLAAALLMGANNIVFAQQAKQISITDRIHEGDIIFQETSGQMSEAIKLATHSKFSHCGVILKKENKWMVFEAMSPVEYTPLEKWMERNTHCVVRRLKDADTKITPNVISAFNNEAKKMEGKPYDTFFNWSDDKLYCSELVYKIYNNALGIKLGTLQQLKDFDLTSSEVKAQLKETYGEKIPYEENVISPVSILKDKNLVTVLEQ